MPYADLEARRAWSREYKRKNAETLREKNRLSAAEYRTRNPDKVKEANARSRAKNIDKVRETARIKAAEIRAAMTPEEKAAATIQRREYRRKQRELNPEAVKARKRRQHIKYTYGISIEERNHLLEMQRGCAICGANEPRHKNGWAVDHCHTTNKVRGVLCQPCNVMIGHAKDKADVLFRAAEYVSKHTASLREVMHEGTSD